MKKVLAVALALICGGVIINCDARKKVDPQQAKIDSLRRAQELRELERAAELEELKHQQQMSAAAAAGTEVSIPCIEYSFDDDEYFRDLGIGKVSGNNKQAARLDAVNQAKSMIKARLGEFIQGVTSEYFNSYAGSKPADDVQHKMESKLNGVVEKMLNDADKECEKSIIDVKGNFEYYYVIRIPKGDLKKQMTDALSNDEKLNIDFNEHKMQQFMDEKMNEMLEAKKNAGY